MLTWKKWTRGSHSHAWLLCKPFSLQPTPSRIVCSMFPLNFTYNNILTPHPDCSYLGLYNTRLDSSRHWVGSPRANIVTKIDVLRPVCMLLGHFEFLYNGIWMSGYHWTRSFPLKACYSNFQDCRKVVSLDTFMECTSLDLTFPYLDVPQKILSIKPVRVHLTLRLLGFPKS